MCRFGVVNMMEYLRVSWRNLSRKRFRTSLTVSGIAIGAASVVLIASVGNMGRSLVGNELQSLGLDGYAISAQQSGKAMLQEEDLQTLRQSELVDLAAPISIQLGRLRMRGLVADSVVWGIDEAARNIYSIELMHGRFLNKNDIASRERVCLVDQKTALAFYKRENIVGKQISLDLDGITAEFEIVGVVSSGGSILQTMINGVIPSFVYLPYTTVQDQTGKAGLDQIAVKAAFAGNVQVSGESILKILERAGEGEEYKIDDLSKQRGKLDGLMNTVSMVLTIIAGISLLVAGLGIMTIMLVSVNERTREIGIKKAIGASSGVIMLEFMLEAFAISLLGSLIGCGLGIWLLCIGCYLYGFTPQISGGLITFCVGFAVTLGLLFGVYPAFLAAKMNPVDALRFE